MLFSLIVSSSNLVVNYKSRLKYMFYFQFYCLFLKESIMSYSCVVLTRGRYGNRVRDLIKRALSLVEGWCSNENLRVNTGYIHKKDDHYKPE